MKIRETNIPWLSPAPTAIACSSSSASGFEDLDCGRSSRRCSPINIFSLILIFREIKVIF